jgi:hypothetical protein
MYSRTFSGLLLGAALSACGGAKDVAATLPDGANDTQMISCATQGAKEFADACPYERSESNDGMILTIHHPDGGFRRLLVTTDGRGVVAADGSEPASVTPVSEGLIEVTLGGDRYRLPATVKGVAKATP